MFSKRLADLRIERNLSQQQVADCLETTRQNISRYENGKNEPKISDIAKICEFLNVSADYLILGKGNRDTFEFLTVAEPQAKYEGVDYKEKYFECSERVMSLLDKIDVLEKAQEYRKSS